MCLTLKTELLPATTCIGNEELLLGKSPSASFTDDKKESSLLSDVLQCIPTDEEQSISDKY